MKTKVLSSLGKSDIGLFSFLASSHPTDTCGNNGLPVTPNSIRIVGRFQELKLLSHPHLCQYIDVVRGKHERLVVASEYYQTTLKSKVKNEEFKSIQDIQRLAYEILLGLDFLYNHGYVHRNLSLDNILLDHSNRVKLSQFGFYHMTTYNDDVAFSISDLRYMAPEVLISGLGYNPLFGPCNSSVDIWSLGVVLLDCFLGGALWSGLNHAQEKIGHFLVELFSMHDKVQGLAEILKVSGCDEHHLQERDQNFYSFVRLCLQIDPRKRCSNTRELFNHAFITSIHDPKLLNIVIPVQFPAVYRSHYVQLPDFNKLLIDVNGSEKDDHLAARPLFEVYHLWRLTGGDVFTELKKCNILNKKPAVQTLPTAMLNNSEEYGSDDSGDMTFTPTIISVSLNQLRERLENIEPSAYYPLVVEDDLYPIDLKETAKLPLVIREQNAGYQFHRIILFERLLEGYPFTRERIVKEARIDIPPYVRGKVWTALLNVTGDIYEAYSAIDKISVTQTDRQIEVDIPRCHQYDYLLSSPVGHKKLKSVLKAWAVANSSKLVYWQGLDSLCAPFLKLNFNNEALAYACLSAFIPKYLYNFFLKDNSQVIHEYLAVFKQLIAFHDPELFNHLNEIGFQPELYAIPWFLTMFSHVFPLQKIYHLWDTLLLGSSMLPLCVGVSILQQFREQLLSFGFNDCILLFSDMPEIDIERCVKDSIKIFNHTPPSSTQRKQDNPANRLKAPAEEEFLNLPEKEFIPLAQLRMEVCIRISPRDLVRISTLTHQSEESYPLLSRDTTNGKTSNSKDSKKKSKNDKNKVMETQKVLVVDLRNAEDFSGSHLPHSVNIPFNQVIDENGDFISSSQTAVLEAHKGRIIMIMGVKGPEPIQLGEMLVSMNYRRVCVMDGSTSILKSLGYFTSAAQ